MTQNYNTRIKNILKTSPIKITEIAKDSKEYQEKAIRNCENIIGTVSLPIGIAGPLLINGSKAKGKYIIPLATTEGCLVASINRGCKAITANKGAIVYAKKVGITRAPVFKVKSAKEGEELIEWAEKNLSKLKKSTKETSSHLKLLKIHTKRAGNQVFIKFFFDSSDAMGMNMATIACRHIINTLITPQTKSQCIAISGNYCTDKKPAAINLIEERGISANAEITISKESCKKILKTSPEKIFEVYKSKIITGSALAGSYGFNAHFANIIAAIFIATGQDPAHTVEGSSGMTSVELTKKNDLYINTYLPSIVCGIIGGGTHLPKQKESLQLLNPKSNLAFAEIIAATILAGELSLLSAIASNDLTTAHDAARKKT